MKYTEKEIRNGSATEPNAPIPKEARKRIDFLNILIDQELEKPDGQCDMQLIKKYEEEISQLYGDSYKTPKEELVKILSSLKGFSR